MGRVNTWLTIMLMCLLSISVIKGDILTIVMIMGFAFLNFTYDTIRELLWIRKERERDKRERDLKNQIYYATEKDS